MSFPKAALRPLSRFFRDGDDGSMTVEAVLWLPLYVAFLGFIADVAVLLHQESQVMRIVHDTQRAGIMGVYGSEEDIDVADEIEQRVLARIQSIAPSATAETETNGTMYRTVISFPASEVMVLGFVSKIADLDISFATFHLAEV